MSRPATKRMEENGGACVNLLLSWNILLAKRTGLRFMTKNKSRNKGVEEDDEKWHKQTPRMYIERIPDAQIEFYLMIDRVVLSSFIERTLRHVSWCNLSVIKELLATSLSF